MSVGPPSGCRVEARARRRPRGEAAAAARRHARRREASRPGALDRRGGGRRGGPWPSSPRRRPKAAQLHRPAEGTAQDQDPALGHARPGGHPAVGLPLPRRIREPSRRPRCRPTPSSIGNQVYHSAGCSGCHGANGEGGVGPALHGGQAGAHLPRRRRSDQLGEDAARRPSRARSTAARPGRVASTARRRAGCRVGTTLSEAQIEAVVTTSAPSSSSVTSRRTLAPWPAGGPWVPPVDVLVVGGGPQGRLRLLAGPGRPRGRPGREEALPREKTCR